MNARDQINKAAFDMMNGMKDAVSSAVMKAVSGGDIKIEQDQLQRLLTVVGGTIEATYHNGNRVFMRSVDVALKNVGNDAEKK